MIDGPIENSRGVPLSPGMLAQLWSHAITVGDYATAKRVGWKKAKLMLTYLERDGNARRTGEEGDRYWCVRLNEMPPQWLREHGHI